MNEIQNYTGSVLSISRKVHGYALVAALTTGLALQCLDPDFVSRYQDLIEYVSNKPSISSKNTELAEYKEQTNNAEKSKEETKQKDYKV